MRMRSKVPRHLLEEAGAWSTLLLGRMRRALRSVVRSREAFDRLERQRRKLSDELESVHRATLEIQALFDGVPDLVMIHQRGTILWNNRALVKALRYETNEDFVGRSLLDLVDPRSRELVQRRMQGIEEGNAPELMEVWVITRDGSRILVELAASQVVTFGGQPARLVVGRDVTERVRMQQELLTADRMGSVGMLAAGVAHEVNNPLAYVLNNIEIAMRSLVPLGEATAESRQALLVALEGVDRIRTIVRDLLLLSRIDDGAMGLVDVRAVVDSTLALAANKVSEHAQLHREYRSAPFVRGTEARLGQVLLNLVANALEAMPTAARVTNELRVVVSTTADGDAVIAVADNGLGIAPEHAARIFEPFFTTKALGRGTGLGLSISQRLVAELGGELSFESTPNRGTTFRVALPAVDPAIHA